MKGMVIAIRVPKTFSNHNPQKVTEIRLTNLTVIKLRHRMIHLTEGRKQQNYIWVTGP
jgi:hypothetical protein